MFNSHLVPSTKDIAMKPGYKIYQSFVTINNELTMKMSLKDMDKGAGIRKMNDSILQDP